MQLEAPVVSLTVLAKLKKTNRERDYAVIGELARLMGDPSQAMLYSRSARDLERLVLNHPDLSRDLAGLPLRRAHEIMVSSAEGVLPFEP